MVNTPANDIPSNADMETYITPGNYSCSANFVAATLKNCPLSVAFSLKIYQSANWTNQYIIQEYTSIEGDRRILKFRSSTSGWRKQTEYITNSDLNSLLGGLCIVNKNLKNNGPGRTICFNGNNIGTTYTGGDSYYIAVDNSQAIHVGYQIGGSKVVTWTSK